MVKLKKEDYEQFRRFFCPILDLDEGKPDNPEDRAKGCWKYFVQPLISQELKKEREEMGKVLRMKRKTYKSADIDNAIINYRIGSYNQAVRKQNQKIDNYLKEKEAK